MPRGERPPRAYIERPIDPPIPDDVDTKNTRLSSGALDGDIYPPDDDVPLDPDVGAVVLSDTKFPSTYFKAEYIKQTRKLCRLGATDHELADFFGVSLPTIQAWRVRIPAFELAMREGKDALDARVERSLYTRAVGYTFDTVKIFMPKDGGEPVKVALREHVPPETTACIFWLKNRQPDRWRDMRHGQLVGNILNVTISSNESKY